METNNPGIPPKPVLEDKVKQTSVQKTIISLLIYLAIVAIAGWSIKDIIIITFVIFIHEMGHLLAMKYFGYRNVNMLFIPLLGGMVSGEKRNVPYWQEIVMLLSGPVPGIIIGMTLWCLPNELIYGYTNELANVFVFLNLLNMLPIYPLDGGRIMEKIFTQGRNLVEILFYCLSAIGLLVIIYNDGLSLMVIIMIPIAFQIIRSIDIMTDRKHLKAIGFDLNKNYEDLSDEEYYQLNTYIKESKPKLNDESRLIYLQSLLTHSKELKLTWKGRLTFFLIWLTFLIAPVIQFVIIIIKSNFIKS